MTHSKIEEAKKLIALDARLDRIDTFIKRLANKKDQEQVVYVENGEYGGYSSTPLSFPKKLLIEAAEKMREGVLAEMEAFGVYKK